MICYLGQTELSKKGGASQWGWPGSLSSCVAGDVFITDRYL